MKRSSLELGRSLQGTAGRVRVIVLGVASLAARSQPVQSKGAHTKNPVERQKGGGGAPMRTEWGGMRPRPKSLGARSTARTHFTHIVYCWPALPGHPARQEDAPITNVWLGPPPARSSLRAGLVTRRLKLYHELYPLLRQSVLLRFPFPLFPPALREWRRHIARARGSVARLPRGNLPPA